MIVINPILAAISSRRVGRTAEDRKIDIETANKLIQMQQEIDAAYGRFVKRLAIAAFGSLIVFAIYLFAA